MAHLRYEESHRLGKWDLMAVIAALIVFGVYALIELLQTGQPDQRILMPLGIGILLLAGIFYYLNSLRLVARYNEKSIKLSLMPVGTVKRKIKWDDVVVSEIVDTSAVGAMDQARYPAVAPNTPSCLHLKLKNDEDIHIGCQNPEVLKHFVEQVKEQRPE